jgi:hypothetical protein
MFLSLNYLLNVVNFEFESPDISALRKASQHALSCCVPYVVVAM